MKKVKQNILHFLGKQLLGTVINFICLTVKIEKINYEVVKNLLLENKNFVLAFWHGTMLMPWYAHKKQNFSTIISMSPDGSLLTNILENWEYTVSRGSSHKGGKNALETLVIKANEGYSIAITPDGPTGPKEKMKAGAAVLAKKTDIPLILLGVGYKNYYQFRSWDEFKLPKFFSKIKLVYSDPIYINSSASFEETNKIINDCEKKLNKLQKDAEYFD